MFFFFKAEDGIRDSSVTGVQTCALPISALQGFGAFLPGHQLLVPRPHASDFEVLRISSDRRDWECRDDCPAPRGGATGAAARPLARHRASRACDASLDGKKSRDGAASTAGVRKRAEAGEGTDIPSAGARARAAIQ